MIGIGQAAEGPSPVAEAKLAPPVLRQEVMDRPRILHALDADEQGALTLVVAPAGYGKTIAVRAWCATRGTPLAWVTLDSGDNDPVRLWTYVATAVDRVREGLGRAALHRLRVPGASIDAAVDELMNGIAAFGHEVVLVLDELETVSDATCLASIDHAVDRLPPNARLVLVTRSDPALRIARLRVRGSARRASSGRAGVHGPGGAHVPRAEDRPPARRHGAGNAAFAHGRVARGTRARGPVAPRPGGSRAHAARVHG